MSTQLEAVENKSLAYKDVTDALGYFDVHSMYVAVMRDNVFPYGPHTLVSSDQQDRLFSLLYSLPAPEKLFVMKCDVLPDPRELDPPIGWKPGGAKLCWDNRPKIQQWYTSVDLELAIASGCVVANPTAAYVWDLKGPIWRSGSAPRWPSAPAGRRRATPWTRWASCSATPPTAAR